MKKLLPPILAVALLAAGLHGNALAATGAGEADFGKLSELASGVKYIEVNLRRNLISLAARLVDRHEPEAAKLLRSVELVRVTVVGLTETNRTDIEQRVRAIHGRLDKAGWERIVTVQENSGEDVGIFIKARAEEALEGVVLTVLDGRKKEAVFINVVGDIKPEQIAALGEALDIDPLKKMGKKARK